MSERDDKQCIVSESEQPCESEAPSDTETQTSVEEQAPSMEELTARISELEQEANELKDRWLRTLAEYQNFRKRVIQERAEFFEEGTKRAVSELLPVLDNLERCLQALNEASDLQALKEGVQLILKQFHDGLSRLNISPIPTVGQQFDPTLHEPFAKVETDEFEEGAVIEEVQRGYFLGDKVLRPAKVKVAVKPSQRVNESTGHESRITNHQSREDEHGEGLL